jgi:hypothetical protein
LEVQNQFGADPSESPLEQRRHPRFKLDVEVRIYSRTAGLVLGRTVDISESGISAMLKMEVALNQVVQLEFMLPRGFVAVRALARQRNCFRYGFQFVEPYPAQELIRRTCRELSVEQSIAADFRQSATKPAL